MYLVVELVNGRRNLFESQQELDEYLKLNRLHDQVKQIREIDKVEYTAIMRETIENLRERRKQGGCNQ